MMQVRFSQITADPRPLASDFSNLASAPDMSGVSSSDPVEDVCDAILAILKWLG